MKLDAYGCSRTGSVRERNEDALLSRFCKEGGLFLVADGMGGREHGELVSGMLRNAYGAWWEETFLPVRYSWTFHDAMESLKETLFGVNQEVVSRFGERRAGSTLALLFLYQGRNLYLSAGDSRIYRLRGWSFQQMTMDDIYGNQPGYDWRKEQGRDAGKLMGAVGIRAVPEFSVRTDRIQNRDFYFVCSDGVYRYVTRRNLFWKLRLFGSRSEPDSVVRRIESEVEKNGSGDNYSMIFIRISEA